MKRRSAFAMHLLAPVALAVWAFANSLIREPLGLELVAVQLLGSGLFFSAPHLLWLSLSAWLRLDGAEWHVGFVLCSIVLVAVALSPMLGARDPSGLPYHWMLYWPAAVLLLLALAFVVYLHRRARAA